MSGLLNARKRIDNNSLSNTMGGAGGRGGMDSQHGIVFSANFIRGTGSAGEVCQFDAR